MEEDGLRELLSSAHLRYRRSAKFVLAFVVVAILLTGLGVWNSMHHHSPAVTQSVYWNGQYDAKTSNFIHDLRNWVDPSFIYFPHRTAFFDVDNIDSDELMLLADNVCRQFSQGVSYHDVDTTVQKRLKAPESPSFHFIDQTVVTYCRQFGARVQSGVTVTSG